MADPPYPHGMSIKVDVDQLASALADLTFAYLITVGDDYRSQTVAVQPVLVDGVLDVGAIGKSTRHNAEAHPGVTVVWPPSEPGGYTLIVDGQVRLADDGLKVTPARAVLAPPGHAGRPRDGDR